MLDVDERMIKAKNNTIELLKFKCFENIKLEGVCIEAVAKNFDGLDFKR